MTSEEGILDRSFVEGALAPEHARLAQALEAARTRHRLDLGGLPPGAAALLLSRSMRGARGSAPPLIVAQDREAAQRFARSLRFFLEEEEGEGVLLFPGYEHSPFVEVAPDRLATMHRLSALASLAEGRARAIVATASGLLRKVPPREAVASASLLIRAEQEVDRDALIGALTEGGYLRVPLVEDPGTFAVRGGILDLYPPLSSHPLRVELDDWLVVSIKRFDPDDQRTLEAVPEVAVHPVQNTIVTAERLALARARVRDRCDAIDLPTRKSKALIDDLMSGRALLSLEGLTPGFYPAMESLFDYLPEGSPALLLDPGALASAATEELERAERDLAAKLMDGEPSFPIEEHYLSEAELAEALGRRPHALAHRILVTGLSPERVQNMERFAVAEAGAALEMGVHDQSPLVHELAARRKARGGGDMLAPILAHAGRWLDGGMRLLITAKSRAQAQRLSSLLGSGALRIEGGPKAFDPASLFGPAAAREVGRARIVIGDLPEGFVWPSEALCFLTEEEIFGARGHRRRARGADKGDKSGARRSRAFVEDLRQLQIGDFVVHVEHGVGRYLGLARMALGSRGPIPFDRYDPTRKAELRSNELEVLVVEYRGGDRLYLPITRLHQIQKHSGGEGAAPKIDRLGGQTFAKTKAKVRSKVRILADDLLRLYAARRAHTREPIPSAERSFLDFEATFPFEETSDQIRAIDEVLEDLSGNFPMDRIVCGDVGFGKTEVAMRAAFRVAMSERQVAVLCPTTVLAQQHYRTFKERLAPYPLRVEVLSRFVDKKEQNRLLAELKGGEIDLLVGTHRILSKDVHFKRLGLLVVDEEQRFGVAHKERIKSVKAEVDVLTLTATPIPRTMQLAVGGLRDLSLITTPPSERRAVRTFVSRWDEALIREAIRRELARGGQVFFVHNRIEGLYERAEKLRALVPEARFVVAHGQMPARSLEKAMTDFVEGAYDILCSTAIIENGLDIPRANTILIDRADLFGMAQLYQLRGRVGRARERAYCYLISPPPQQMSEEARTRIETLMRFSELGSGFSVASLDMELRGAGDVLGAEQSGSVAAVGFDLFLRMLEEAVSELRGEPLRHEVDPEITTEMPHLLPEDYIDEVGLRLSFYKRFASADEEEEVHELAIEMEDRFGPLPPVAEQLVRVMALRPGLRRLRALGCEARAARTTFHLQADHPLSPESLLALARDPRVKLTPDGKLTLRHKETDPGDALERARAALDWLLKMAERRPSDRH